MLKFVNGKGDWMFYGHTVFQVLKVQTKARRLNLFSALGIGLTLLGTAALAEVYSYRVVVGNHSLGTLKYEITQSNKGRTSYLRTILNNTPLGIFNGEFSAVSRIGRDSVEKHAVQYVSNSNSTRKNRTISILFEGDRATEVKVEPLDEETPLSQIYRVPAGVLDPVAAFGMFLSPSRCPEGFNIYDGRRVVRLSTAGSDQNIGILTCHMKYDVTAGPGHLKPFLFTTVSINLMYKKTDSSSLDLIAIGMRAGIFSLKLER